MTADAARPESAGPRVLTPFVVAVLLVVVPSLVVGAAAWVLALRTRDLAAAQFGGIAPDEPDLSLAGHVLVIVLLFWLLVAKSRSLWGGGGGRVVAVAVVLLTAVGPGSLAAVPAFSWTIDSARTFGSTGVVLWWPAALGLGWLALVLGTAVWSLRVRPAVATASYLARGRFLLAVLAFAGVLAVPLLVGDFWLDPGHVELDPQMQLGWSVLAAGLVTAAATTSSLGSRLAMVLLAPAVVAQMYLAYNSQGGWPHVPGWEGGRAPLYSTVGIAVIVCAAPLVGWAVGAADLALERALARRRPGHAAEGVPAA